MRRTHWLILSVVIFVVSVLAPGCRLRRNSSAVKTTSDKLKEYRFQVLGQIEIPTDENAFKTSHYFDVVRKGLDHPDDPNLVRDSAAILASYEAFKSNYDIVYRNAVPVLKADGNVNPRALKYWIARQGRFMSAATEPYGVNVTLDKILRIVEAKKNGENVLVTFEAEFLGTRDVRQNTETIQGNPLQVGNQISSALNPVETYFRNMSPAAQTQFAAIKSAMKTGAGAFAEIAKNDVIKFVESTKKENPENKCIKSDEYPISPYNYFYYFKADKCAPEHVSKIAVTKSEVLNVGTTYPEFHELYADNFVNIFIFYGMVGSETQGASVQAIERFKRNGYQLKKAIGLKNSEEETPHELTEINFLSLIHSATLEKKIGDVTFQVEFVGENKFPNAKKELVKSVGSYEVVLYDGHAGFGGNIESAFTDPDAYPSQKYQILYLNGCRTYKYGMAEVLTSKGLRDGDFSGRNVDVITTAYAAKGHETNWPLIDALEVAALKYKLANGEWSAQDREALSWLGIITKTNYESDRQYGKEDEPIGYYAVSGEENNVFTPGVSAYEPLTTKQITWQQVLKETQLTEDQRIKLIAHEVTKIRARSSAPDVFAKQVKMFCEELIKLEGYDEGFGSYFSSTCIPQGTYFHTYLEGDLRERYKGQSSPESYIKSVQDMCLKLRAITGPSTEMNDFFYKNCSPIYAYVPNGQRWTYKTVQGVGRFKISELGEPLVYDSTTVFTLNGLKFHPRPDVNSFIRPTETFDIIADAGVEVYRNEKGELMTLTHTEGQGIIIRGSSTDIKSNYLVFDDQGRIMSIDIRDQGILEGRTVEGYLDYAE